MPIAADPTQSQVGDIRRPHHHLGLVAVHIGQIAETSPRSTEGGLRRGCLRKRIAAIMPPTRPKRWPCQEICWSVGRMPKSCHQYSNPTRAATPRFHQLRSTNPRVTSTPRYPKITPLAPTTTLFGQPMNHTPRPLNSMISAVE